jgi:hypothetical protein
MGILLISNNTQAPWNSKVVPPVTRGLEGWFTFDTDVSRFALNRAIGKADAAVIGSPTAYATHGRFQGRFNFLQTPIAESDEQTLIVVGKSVNAPTGSGDASMLVGNFTGTSATPGLTGGASGTNIYLRTSTKVTGGAGRDNSAGGIINDAAETTGMLPTAWAIRAVRTKTGVPTKVYDLTAHVSAESSNSLTRGLSNTMFRVGSGTSTDFAGASDISAVAIYSKYLTDDEINLIAATMRKRMARLGIAV